MIPFFPTPHPDELWYGAVTRFHLLSGFAFWTDSLRVLFPYQKAPAVGSLLPNEAMRQLVQQLPKGVLSLEELVLRHSQFSFRLLFLGKERKLEYLRQYLHGEDIQPKLLSLTKKLREHPLRYCPACAREDAKEFGEAYWHTGHQIWLMPLCPVHGCRLVAVPCRTTMSIGRQLVLIPNQLPEPDFNATETERQLTALLHSWYRMPLEANPSIGTTDNLGRAIENAGFLAPGNVKRMAWDTGRLYTALTDKFGVDVVTEMFGRNMTTAHVRRLRLGEIACTEEYALLSALLGLEADVLFTQDQIPLDIQQRMLTLSRSGRPCTKKNVAELLGIRIDQVMPYAERFGIKPFWIQSGKKCSDGERQTYSVTIHLSDQERRQLDAYMLEHHMTAYSHALRYFMLEALQMQEPNPAIGLGRMVPIIRPDDKKPKGPNPILQDSTEVSTKS